MTGERDGGGTASARNRGSVHDSGVGCKPAAIDRRMGMVKCHDRVAWRKHDGEIGAGFSRRTYGWFQTSGNENGETMGTLPGGWCWWHLRQPAWFACVTSTVMDGIGSTVKPCVVDPVCLLDPKTNRCRGSPNAETVGTNLANPAGALRSPLQFRGLP